MGGNIRLGNILAKRFISKNENTGIQHKNGTEKIRKVKLSLFLTNKALRHEDLWETGCIDPRFLDLGTSWRWVISFTPRLLYPRGKEPAVPVQGAGWTTWRNEDSWPYRDSNSELFRRAVVASRHTDSAIRAPQKIRIATSGGILLLSMLAPLGVSLTALICKL
jgi:hypothetical protein